MKKLLLCIVCIIMCAMPVCVAQTVNRNGNNFEQVSNGRTSSVETAYTYTFNGTVYPVYINKATGRCHIKVVSKNGKTYSKYLPEDVEKQICKEMNIAWTPKKTRG